MTIWEACNGPQHIGPLSGTLFRLVESQEQIATLGYVDTLEEQALLEELLEGVKPPYPENSDRYHYLLKTPFRYPPLRWGSRFGRINEPSIFYGGCLIETALAESAYYRFVFWFSMDAAPIKDKLRTEHTLLSVDYRTTKGVRLNAPPFDKYKTEMTHPKDYRVSQLLGSAMRAAEVNAFEYQSARDPQQGTCVGLFSLSAFKQKRPEDMSPWLCEVSATEVSFKQAGSRAITTYVIEDFLFENRLPFPP